MEFIKLARRRGVVADLIHVIFNVIFAGASGLPDVLGTAGKTAEPDRNARVM